ncbi:MAG: hypothetical protein U9N86_19270 [Bacteroidota bacterium]|nr:hypothetical protein [Bacteroidota bacterium]
MIIFLAWTCSACKSEQINQFNINRFDVDLFSLNPDSLAPQINTLIKQYPKFLPIFTEHIIDIGQVNDPNLGVYLKQFVTDPVILEVYSKTGAIFEDFSFYAKQIANGISEYQKITGSPANVNIIGFISGFNQSFVTMESALAIGLDNYLGADCQYYKQLRLPDYVIKKMSPEFLVADALRAWVQSDLEGSSKPETVLDHIIFEGKILYAAIQVLEKNQELKVFGYSPDQISWCTDHEKAIWEFMAESEMIFSSDALMIQRLSKEAPFTRDFGLDSPPKAGAWIGYRIIEKFMAKNKVGLEELLFKYKATEILAKSAYRP